MNVVLIMNAYHDSEWVTMNVSEGWYMVIHYVGNEVKRQCRYDDFFEAVECLKEWQSYFETE